MEANTTKHILTAVSESLGIPLDDLKPADRLVELADSMEMAQLILDLELDFNIDVPDDDLKGFFTVQDLITYVDKRSAALGHS